MEGSTTSSSIFSTSFSSISALVPCFSSSSLVCSGAPPVLTANSETSFRTSNSKSAESALSHTTSVSSSQRKVTPETYELSECISIIMADFSNSGGTGNGHNLNVPFRFRSPIATNVPALLIHEAIICCCSCLLLDFGSQRYANSSPPVILVLAHRKPFLEGGPSSNDAFFTLQYINVPFESIEIEYSPEKSKSKLCTSAG
mmetsp:Transcript_19192/g.31481  ORF Transcript_19192/g.31481 Transcript_19192/m.31481 type:complete len:201 (+) Transcript_19192:3351-3953(+)